MQKRDIIWCFGYAVYFLTTQVRKKTLFRKMKFEGNFSFLIIIEMKIFRDTVEPGYFRQFGNQRKVKQKIGF